MGKSLVIVESPAKARTITKFLGKDFTVMASIGHVKDLPKSALGVDVENSFTPEYQVIRGKRKVLSEIRKQAESADAIYLAPDPDREGEAIAWHIAEEIQKKNKKIYRVLFHEITRASVQQALSQPLKLDRNKYESQQARRILDRLVGYKISPILWEKVQRGLSAGRVQSVAVKIVVEREQAIRDFVPEEYWSIEADYLGSKEPIFTAKLLKLDDEKARIPDQAQAEAVVAMLQKGVHRLDKVEKKQRRRNPAPPFITSKLQQEAARRLRFSPKQTMMFAQQLYEGVELGAEGAVGLITYMRTDSVRISDVAQQEVREHILASYGPDYLPEKPNVYRNKKGSQDAHEAIRPTSIQYDPERIKGYLTPSQYKLYRLIWDRFVASQMASALFDATSFDVVCERALLRATGQVMRFAGFMKVYTERKDDGAEGENDSTLPDLSEGETLAMTRLDHKQNFTQPPPRFTEAMLVKEMEESGIGRPSTYASILSTIQDKNYVKKEEGRLRPTELGEIVTRLLGESFPRIMDTEFTAGMEEQLDEVEEGKLAWLDLLTRFYGPFSELVDKAREGMRNVKREEVATGLSCPKCQSALNIKWGRNGSFIGCSAYPECDFTSEYTRDDTGKVSLVREQTTDVVCDRCQGKMVVKNGRFGKFLACSNYPECKNTMAVKTGVKCPENDCKGDIIEKRTRKGKLFFGCDQFPACKFASWDRPHPVACPICSYPILVERGKGEGAKSLRCPSCNTSFDRDEMSGEENRPDSDATTGDHDLHA